MFSSITNFTLLPHQYYQYYQYYQYGQYRQYTVKKKLEVLEVRT